MRYGSAGAVHSTAADVSSFVVATGSRPLPLGGTPRRDGQEGHQGKGRTNARSGHPRSRTTSRNHVKSYRDTESNMTYTHPHTLEVRGYAIVVLDTSPKLCTECRLVCKFENVCLGGEYFFLFFHLRKLDFCV